MREFLKLVDLRALLALHVLLVLLNLALLRRGHGIGRLSRQNGSEEESLELHFWGVVVGARIEELNEMDV